MFETNIEYKKGVLFIRITGSLNKENSYKLKKEIIPLILKNGFKYVVLNLNEVDILDNYGIEVIDEINDVVLKFNGKTTLIDTKKIEKKIKGTLIDKILYKVKNERTALGIFEL